MLSLTAAQAGPGAPATISSITLERGCFGCATGSIVTLRRDGPSSVTLTGNARHGTQDVTQEGAVIAADFDALARLLEANGFFALAQSYEDPELRDGAWATLTAVRDGHATQVFSRTDAAPAKLRDIQRAVDALGARINGSAVKR